MAYYRYSTFERYPPRYVLPDELARNTTQIKLWLLAPLLLISVCLFDQTLITYAFLPSSTIVVALLCTLYHHLIALVIFIAPA